LCLRMPAIMMMSLEFFTGGAVNLLSLTYTKSLQWGRAAAMRAFAGLASAGVLMALAAAAVAAPVTYIEPSVPWVHILFAMTLVGVVWFGAMNEVLSRWTWLVALVGLTVIILFKWGTTGFREVPGLEGLRSQLCDEWSMLANLFLLLIGFRLVAGHFEDSHLPQVLAQALRGGPLGGFLLLLFVFVLSMVLDNIAAALIGGTVATKVFHEKVPIGFLAAIVAAANAGGAPSVVGDTTTTMMWIAGVGFGDLSRALLGSVTALLVFGILVSWRLPARGRVGKGTGAHWKATVDWPRVWIVAFVMVVAIVVNLGIK
jgi:Na+/H+ antiporter NhaD/arsenite permease-like protein